MRSKIHLARRFYVRLGIIGAFVLSVACGGLFVVSARPDLAAQGADALRAVLGNEATARLEMALFSLQDVAQKIRYSSGAATVAPPWQSTAVVPVTGSTLSTADPLPSFTATPSPVPTQVLAEEAVYATTTPTLIPTQANTPTPTMWQPAPMQALGKLAGEATWTPYLHAPDGRILAYRAFLQPDPSRPYAVVAVIAFDLQHTRLHYVLGFEEPYAPGVKKQPGSMPEADKTSGRLLAMFNGGFKATHGQFGAMADGYTALPAKDGLGTLVMYKDGRASMGVWGKNIEPSLDLESWRQNCPLVIEDGKINPAIYNNSPSDWGYTINDVSPTWRSGVGISADGATLYYFAGKSLSLEALAKSMLAAGVAQGMQLDINIYWVHFVAVQYDNDGQISLDGLFPEMNKSYVDRYLYQYSRDFFYVTAGE